MGGQQRAQEVVQKKKSVSSLVSSPANIWTRRMTGIRRTDRTGSSAYCDFLKTQTTVGEIINFLNQELRSYFWKPELLLRRDSASESRDSEMYSKTSRAHSWSVVVTISFYITRDQFVTSTGEGQRNGIGRRKNERRQKSSDELQAGVLVLFFCVCDLM